MKLDVESLRAFRLVVDTGGFTGAATELGVTQSAVSWKIKRLEERVGVELLKRGAEVEATPDGRDLLVYADRMIAAHDDAVAHLNRSDLEGVIRLGMNEDIGAELVATVLASFGRAYPNVRLDVVVDNSGRIAEWFDDGTVDLALLQLTDGQIDPDDHKLWREPLRWVAGPQTAFDPGAEVPLISFGDGWLSLGDVTEALAIGGVRTRVAVECPSLSMYQAAVEAGLGVGVLNDHNITDTMQPWPAPKKAALPEVTYVVRTATHGDREALAALRAELIKALEI